MIFFSGYFKFLPPFTERCIIHGFRACLDCLKKGLQTWVSDYLMRINLRVWVDPLVVKSRRYRPGLR